MRCAIDVTSACGIAKRAAACRLRPLRRRVRRSTAPTSGGRANGLEALPPSPFVIEERARPPVTARYPLADAGQALTDMAAGKILGKAVITIAE